MDKKFPKAKDNKYYYFFIGVIANKVNFVGGFSGIK